MADILIRGLSLPESGFLNIEIAADGSIWKKFDGLLDATAIELPEHGDLIDRDALPKERVEWEDIVNAPVVIPANKEESE